MAETALQNQKLKTADIAYIAMFSALITVCSWIAIPTAVPFTLQTFAVFAALLILGGRRGFFAVVTYVLLGAVGAPVFAEFTGGPGILFGMTGGYILGFIIMAAVYWFAERFIGKSPVIRIISLIVGLLACYAFGTAWFIHVYSRENGAIGVSGALSMCVTPFMIPDGVKLFLAVSLQTALRKRIKI